jgi:hypothetical protein
VTNQQLADQLLAQWQLLWWAKPAERMRIIDETRKDMEFEEQLHAVAEQMEEAA